MALQHIILGTAGHIDHGKSTLVKALTGTDPDRLQEEKARGITIELGFAQLPLGSNLVCGIVDVPGHERFVRQMIAGATGIDLALLCIAADDGIMPQTREHLAVLEMLGVQHMVVALTKCDSFDDEWISLLTDDIRAFLADTPYAQAAIIPTSARTGRGIPELKESLLQAAKQCKSLHTNDIMRMPVDRVFTIKGAGTVVTGTLWSGTVRKDDDLEIHPSGALVRVRGVQSHDTNCELAHESSRVALNLAGITTSDIRPGCVLTSPNSITDTDRFDAFITNCAPLKKRPLKTGTRLRIAHGTKEVFGRVLLMNKQESLESNQRTFAQIRLEEALTICENDRFILRTQSPVCVLGGGIVLRAHPKRRTTLDALEESQLNALLKGDYATAFSCALERATAPFTLADFQHLSGLPLKECTQRLQEACSTNLVVALGAFYAPRALQTRLSSSLEQTVLSYHQAHPDKRGMPKQELFSHIASKFHPPLPVECCEALLNFQLAKGALELDNALVAHKKAAGGARKNDETLKDTLLSALRDAASTPPLLPALFKQADIHNTSLAYRIIGALAAEGSVVRIQPDLAFEKRAYEQLKDAVVLYLQANTRAQAADLKNAMGVSRKYAIPLLEYFDSKHITKRAGDFRELA